MPYYSYRNEETGEEIELLQSVHQEHIYVTEGVTWQRIWTVPNISVDNKIDPFSEKKFLEKTNKVSTLGDLWDRGAEWSQLRAEKAGKDEIKENHKKEQDAKDLAIKKARRAAKTKGKQK